MLTPTLVLGGSTPALVALTPLLSLQPRQSMYVPAPERLKRTMLKLLWLKLN
jgi:hypothetical protein